MICHDKKIDAKNVFEHVEKLKKDYEHLSFITAVDYEKNFEIVYHFYSYKNKKHYQFKSEIPKERPEIESVSSLWKTADWHERECYDFFGIKFLNHPNLKRILCPETWHVHPMRKDYIPKKEPMEWDEPPIKPKNGEILINMGPQHPSTHGVCRLLLKVEGELIKDVYPIIGYQYRSFEKIAETRTYEKYISYVDRLDWLASMINNYLVASTVEELAEIEVPERAEYIRCMVMELNRIAAHLMGVGSFFNDIGFFFTPILYMLRERESILDLLCELSGGRLTYNYIRIGGVAHDLPPGFLEKVERFCNIMDEKLDEYHQLLTGNEIVVARSKGVGIITKKEAFEYGATGPVARASGVDFDARRDDTYSLYKDFDFKIPVLPDGDVYSRYLVRMEEMRQSVRIIEQCVDRMPSGKYKEDVPRIVKPPIGEIYRRIEAPKGELGLYVVSKGEKCPYRLKIRSPSFNNLHSLKAAAKNAKIPDLVIIFGSLDTVMGEVDR